MKIIYAVTDMKIKHRMLKGFTLLEMLLVLVIVSAIVAMAVNYSIQKADQFRRDKMIAQMQELVNASLAYYVSKGKWPMAGQCGNTNGWEGQTLLLQNGYIPQALNNPYGSGFILNCDSNTGNLFIVSGINGANANLNASVIAGALPLGYIANNSNALPPAATQTCSSSTSCTVVAQATIPGQNLNNARSINFASVYHNGGCVPAPKCPPNMKPAVFVTPVGVSGIYYAPSGCGGGSYPWSTSSCNAKVYPVSSFVSFARGDASGNPVDPNSPGPLDCGVSSSGGGAYGTLPCDYQAPSSLPSDGTKYWRVCLSIITERGYVTPGSYEWGKLTGSILAMTRCVPNNGSESPSGSNFNVWSPNNSWATP